MNWNETKTFCKTANSCLPTKQCYTKTQIIYSVRRQTEIESILHGRAENEQHLERCGEVS